MRIVQIFMQLQEFLWVDFIFRHINSSKIYSGGFLSTWRPNRKSFENQAHFVSLSETSVLYFLCDVCEKKLASVAPIDIYLSGLLARRQNAWSQDGGNMRVIANGVNRWPVSRSACGPFGLFWYVALCRVVWCFKTNYNYTRPNVPHLTVVSLYSCMSTGRWSLICSGFLQ